MILKEVITIININVNNNFNTLGPQNTYTKEKDLYISMIVPFEL